MSVLALALVRYLLALVLAPLLFGVINQTKALAAGRVGQPLLQPYRELAKLLRKGAVYSRTTTWVFRLAPLVTVATGLCALLLLPMAGAPAVVSFAGDIVLFAYLLGVSRFIVVLAALDTGSAFEGMGASREAFFSALAEPALFVCLGTVARRSGAISLTDSFAAITQELWHRAGPELALVVVAIGIVVLAENARIPFDDPNTHLELTMIHEVMVLDHSGPDLAAIEYGSALKLWLTSALLVDIAVPVRNGQPWVELGAFLVGMMLVAVVIGIIESTMARLKLVRVSQLLIGAGGLSAIALVLSMR
jgi:formate hydrogenlyase subunit 4